jgi:hypothetical protein
MKNSPVFSAVSAVQISPFFSVFSAVSVVKIFSGDAADGRIRHVSRHGASEKEVRLLNLLYLKSAEICEICG